MAYAPKLLNNDGEEQDQTGAPGAPTAPTISGPTIGSTPSFGGTAAGNSAASPGAQAQSQQQAPGAGTGFVNIDKYLGANQGEGKRIAGIAADQRKKDADAFDKNASAFREGVQSAAGPQTLDQITIDALLPQAKDDRVVGTTDKEGYSTSKTLPGAVQQGNPAALAAAQGALSQQYGGPTSLETKTGNADSDSLSKLLSNPNTAAAKLATMGTGGTYNPQLSALDQAILGGQKADLDQISTDQAAENTRQGTQKTELEKMASDKAASISGARDAATGLLRGTASQIQGAGPLNKQGALQLNAIGALLGDPTLSGATAAPLPTPAPGQPGGPSVPGGIPAGRKRTAEAARLRNGDTQPQEALAEKRDEKMRKTKGNL